MDCVCYVVVAGSGDAREGESSGAESAGGVYVVYSGDACVLCEMGESDSSCDCADGAYYAAEFLLVYYSVSFAYSGVGLGKYSG